MELKTRLLYLGASHKRGIGKDGAFGYFLVRFFDTAACNPVDVTLGENSSLVDLVDALDSNCYYDVTFRLVPRDRLWRLAIKNIEVV